MKAILRGIALIKITKKTPLYSIGDLELEGILRRKVVTEFRRRYLVVYTVTAEE